jgi:hypothetical protein
MSIFNITEVKARTAAARNPVPSAQLTSRDQAILDAVNNGSWGCQDLSVRALVTAITGVNCTASAKTPYVVGTMIVYDLGVPETFLVRKIDSDGDAMIFTATGETESRAACHPFFSPQMFEDGRVRWATDEEIDAFFGNK